MADAKTSYDNLFGVATKPPPEPVIKGVQAPIISAPLGTKTPIQEKYHQQRLDALNSLRALHTAGKDIFGHEPAAEKALNTLLSIYSKLPTQKDSFGTDATGRSNAGPGNQGALIDAIDKVAPPEASGFPIQTGQPAQ